MTVLVLAAAITVAVAATAAGSVESGGSGLQSSAVQGSYEIFVDANARSGGDGSATRPFRTISLALALAREIRAVSVEPISINVAAGSYVGQYPSKKGSLFGETLPLVLDVNALTIRGPEEAGTGQMVKITAVPPLGVDQAAVALIADDVTIEHIAINAGQADFDALLRNFPSYGLFIDRARDFSVRDVRIAAAGNGIFSRLAGGEILNSEMTGSLVGSFIGAGSEDLGYPAKVRYERTRVALNCIGGAFFSTGTFPSRHPPFGSAGERVLPDAPIPPAPVLDLDLVGSEIVGNSPGCNAAGVQFFLHVFDDGGQAGSMVARVENNTIARNGGHDLAVDSHLDPTPETCGPTAPAAFTGQFAGNVYSADRSKIFFGFAFRYLGDSCYVTDSSIDISYPGDEMDGFSHDNPPGYRNVLTVNGVPIED
jgi:hypothetical protein